jgi:hypothetical protein
MPAEERLILCGFVGDPGTAGRHAWRPKPYKPGNEIVLNEKGNGYVAVSSFTRADDGTFRRRNECFGAGLALMIDDVGTKVERKDDWPPASAVVETSPGNFQFWFFLRERERDISKFDAVIDGFIQQKLMGLPDPGMGGVTRVGRIPGFVNGKTKYNGFVTRLAEFNPEIRYTTDELVCAFDLKLRGRRTFNVGFDIVPDNVTDRMMAWGTSYKQLKEYRMIGSRRDRARGIEPEADKSGWIEIMCPWLSEHSGTNEEDRDNGSAIKIPDEANNYYGGFRCHHGHCADRGWGDLRDWLAERAHEDITEADAGNNAALFEQSMGFDKK